MGLLAIDGKRIDYIPHGEEFDDWKSRLPAAAYQVIVEELERRTEGKRIEVSSWIPGGEWTGTVFQPIYDALHDFELSAKFFGLLVWEHFLTREEDWYIFRPGEGSMIRGIVYFQPT